MSPGALPYPTPIDPAVSHRMTRNRRRDTRPELRIRSLLHRSGLRFRVDHPVRVGDITVRPDIVFTRLRLAVFVDGCFWHSCPMHGNMPRRNPDYWAPKLARNIARDRRVDAALTAAGWSIVRIWEHEPPSSAAEAVRRYVASARGLAPSTGAETRRCSSALRI